MSHVGNISTSSMLEAQNPRSEAHNICFADLLFHNPLLGPFLDATAALEFVA